MSEGCSVEGCDARLYAKGFCNAHYKRARRGAPLVADIAPRGLSLAEQLWRQVDKTGDCWLWTGRTNSDGYAVLRVGGRAGKNRKAHRVAYELEVGPIPEGTVLDHLCRVRHCVNPAHLEPVTAVENTHRRRGIPNGPRKASIPA